MNEKEPSSAGVYFCAVLMALIGCGVGVMFMLSHEPKAFGSLSERDAALEDRETTAMLPSDVFYIEGATSRSRSWEGKRNELFEGLEESGAHGR